MLLELMAKDLGLPENYLSILANTASYRYYKYRIEKKGSRGRFRTIHHPSRELKAAQRWLASKITSQFPIHNSAAAYVKGKGISDNAKKHAGSSFTLRMDFENFFPSITIADIKIYLDYNASTYIKDWDKQSDSDLFCKFCCRFDALVIGAPTSPSLSNALCYALDDRLSSQAKSMSIKYTRYADDLTFSTKNRDVLYEIPSLVYKTCRNLQYPSGLVVNSLKTKHTSKKKRRIVTGIVLTSDGNISPGREYKRIIRSSVHTFLTTGHTEQGLEKLKGMISYANSIEPDFSNRLIVKYGSDVITKIIKG